MMEMNVTTRNEVNPGAITERSIRRKRATWIGACAMLGAIAGIAALYATDGSDGASGQTLPLWMAALGAISAIAFIAAAFFFYERRTDEVDRAASHAGYAVGVALSLMVYPAWYLFWWAGHLAEPSHEILMTILYAGTIAGYYWHRCR